MGGGRERRTALGRGTVSGGSGPDTDESRMSDPMVIK